MSRCGTVAWLICLAAIVLLSTGTAWAGTIKGEIKVRGLRSPKDVVVYVDRVQGEFKPPEKHAIMDQKGMVFMPHVLPIVAGTTVDFHNNDPVLHNVFTPDECAEKFNLGTWAAGEVRSYTYKRADCMSVILCNVHPEMEAWVVVLQNPYFYKTGKDGRFIIENVPAGKYTLKVWHEKAKGPTQEVTVPEKGEVIADFNMKRKR
jgi:plastocyanin